MNPSKTLVVYYSRTGTTRRVAEEVAKRLDAQLAELRDATQREGLVGYLRCGLDGTLARLAQLTNPYDDASAYELVVVGTPVWNASLSSPVRTFLRRQRGRLNKVAFFLTEGGRGSERVFRQMATEVGREPVARLALRAGDVQGGVFSGAVAAFVRGLLPTPAARPPPPRPGSVAAHA